MALRPWQWLSLLICGGMVLMACSGKEEPSLPRSASSPAVTLKILAGSESKAIAPIIEDCARRQGIEVQIRYSGSVDMMLEMRKADFAFDAALPASSIWLRLGDQHHRRVKEEASIMRSPVVLGVKTAMARSLGWVGRDVTVGDILAAVQSGRIHFAMTSATQSNSGFSAYMGMLIALSGHPDVLTAEHLDRPDLHAKIKNLLSGVNRGSGSSGWLMETFVADAARLDAMFNYESMIIAANRELIAQGHEPLYVVYPVDGLAVADSTLGFIDRPERADNAARKAAFLRLRDCLLEDNIQKRILATGFRAGLIGMNPESAPKAVYNPDWGIDLGRTISPVAWPEAGVTLKALDLYQTVLRKPSFTVLAVDCSGSMAGEGLPALKRALAALFDPQEAETYLIQTGANDVTVVLPFDDKFLWDQPLVVQGNDPADLRALVQRVNTLETRGGTNIYNPIVAAWRLFQSAGPRLAECLPAVILMTDGRSQQGSLSFLQERWQQLGAAFDLPPVFAIMYGQASDAQLKEITAFTHGRVFDGRAGGLTKAFRTARGYN